MNESKFLLTLVKIFSKIITYSNKKIDVLFKKQHHNLFQNQLVACLIAITFLKNKFKPN